ncbi:hypothetical protein [Desulfosporosinus orientis]|uniref:hypothetical protein n=1 Tax=Desulfosporosinus orientis TaxID=1563 RepID=UPI0002EF5FF1|nr:hypothetical protein [Desulfosporosinus orientis]
MNKKLNEAHNKACANRVAFLYESLDKTLKELTSELRNLSAIEPTLWSSTRHFGPSKLKGLLNFSFVSKERVKKSL